MKKLFTLLTLALMSIGSAWADDVIFSSECIVTADANVNASTTDQTLTSDQATVSGGTMYVTNSETKAQKYLSKQGESGNKRGAFCIAASKVSFKLSLSQAVKTGDKINCILYTANGSTTIGLKLNGTAIGDVTTPSSTAWTAMSTYIVTDGDGIAGKNEIVITRTQGKGTYFTNFTITRAISGPTINTQPVSASCVTGTAATPLSVSATASAGSLSYQWYSNTTETTAGATAIDGETTATYTPSTAAAGTTYYYCALTDDNGTVNTNIVSVVVAAAAAPTISVSGTPGAAVAVGTSVTMTAALTGNPSPIVQWYSNTTASNTAGTIIDGATSEAYSPSTASAGTYYFYAVATNSQGSATSDVQTVTVQEKLKAPTIETASIAFVSSIDVAITDNSGNSATIKYSTDGGTVWNDYSTLSITAEGTTTVQAKVVKDGYFDSDVVTTKYKKVASLHNATTVSEYTVWDWTKATTQVNLDDTTIPSRDAENVNAADFDGTVYDNVGWIEGFNAQALVMSKFQRPFDSSNKAYQGTSLKFTTTVPGAVKVEFCNTGSSSRPYRYLYVNGTATEYKSNGTSKVTTDFIPVEAGEVELKGVIKAGEGADVDTENYLRVFKVTFAPTETATITTADYATYVPSFKVAVPDGVKAYIVSATTSSEATLAEVSVIPADEPVIIYKDVDANTEVTFTATDAAAIDVTGNKLQTGAVASADGTQYILANGGSGVGFYKATTGTSIAEGKAYLVSPSGAPVLLFNFFDDLQTTGINAVNGSRFMVNGSQVYNLNGQRVAQPTKGLYIVNGKKVAIK